ncbi:MAG: radical SAM family heme chaperone HemW [Armatimonadetes bacterium]|nr:radical SAM family heme chaperone HemW [Armatimonadota bacterium]
MIFEQQPNRRPPKAAYVHIPFCISKCHYCEFNSYPGLDPIFGQYVQALIAEIQNTPGDTFDALDTVYFGGGTPTILPANYLMDALAALRRIFGIAQNAEITIEANPGAIDEPKLSQLRSGGFNRLSIGVQSFDDELLKSIGRAHTAQQAIDAYQAARQAGFANIGIDLIFALPGQTLENWKSTLSEAIELRPEHISLYELSIEEGTRFSELCQQGKLNLPDEDLQLEMYELVISTLTKAGFEHYEVSNFAQPGFRSRHNQVYWRNKPYYGFGAGATSYLDGVRARRVADPKLYITKICSESDPYEFSEHLTGRAMLAETIIQGLRMLDGIDTKEIDSDYCTDIALEFEQEIAKLIQRGLLEEIDGKFKVTHQGLLLMNDVAAEFVCSSESQ